VQFLAKLQVLFPSFAESLKNRHPNLSNNEFRLAVLIKLNLSDKEISELLFIEIPSVKKAKNRLKQKLQLDASDKLDAYIGLL
jgi:DNA-binding NarL/FixJ family response regulator